MRQYLELTRGDCTTVGNWFSFVPTQKRTDIDCRLAQRIEDAAYTGDFRDGELLFNNSELLMALRWFHECPNGLADQSDFDVCVKIEPFLLALIGQS